ncbi:hypothetical protein HYN48_07690 [Flavobacterium magnum]|uniref:Uncharacterized protein n=1 Tax=Flavobacterium magnum TaxID=2162713 RepID=A0A2S0REM0_9FLAO|nr:hypothetical protein [Flavobacterium magnum]AWA29969.1 hypothetical protein HYN48_07690 [Flavobacterium magnum]
MKNTLLLLACLVSFAAFSQQRALELTNNDSGKIKTFIENERVKARTLDHKKHVGLLAFTDNTTLKIGNHTIPIDSLQSIKKQPKVLGTVKTVVLFAGLATVATSIAIATAGNNAAFLVFVAGSGATIGAGIMEAANSNYTTRKWTFKIVEK